MKTILKSLNLGHDDNGVYAGIDCGVFIRLYPDGSVASYVLRHGMPSSQIPKDYNGTWDEALRLNLKFMRDECPEAKLRQVSRGETWGEETPTCTIRMQLKQKLDTDIVQWSVSRDGDGIPEQGVRDEAPTWESAFEAGRKALETLAVAFPIKG